MDNSAEAQPFSSQSDAAGLHHKESTVADAPPVVSSEEASPHEEASMITPAATPTGNGMPEAPPVVDAVDATNKAEADAASGIRGGQDPKKEDATNEGEGEEGSDEEKEDDDPEEREKKAAKLVMNYGKYLQRMEDRVIHLEKKIQDLESDGQDLMAKKKAKVAKRVPAIPELRRVDWHRFKNRHVDDETVYAIDVLVGKAEYYYERRKDKQRRKQRLDAGQGDLGIETERGTSGHAELPERIRINSLPLLSILAEMVSRDAWTSPIVLLRPFKILTKLYDEIKQYHTFLENKWAETLEAEDTTVPPDATADDANASESKSLPQKAESKETSEDLADSPEALKDIRCLIDFLEQDFKPVTDRIRADSCTKVKFHELWHLFKRGDELHAPVRNKAVSGTVQPAEGTLKSPAQQEGEGRSQTAFICCQASGGRPYLSPVDDYDANVAPKKKLSSFWVRSFYIEYYGKEFGPVRHDFEILPFEGEKEITALEVFPLKYSRNQAKIKSHLVERGRKFKCYTSVKHQMYSGPTFTHAANGGSIGASIGKSPPKRHEHIKGRVVVDFRTAIVGTDWFILPYSVPADLPEEWRTLNEEYPFQVWKDHEGKENHSSIEEYIYDDDHVDRELRSDYVAKDPFLTKYTERTDEDQGDADELTERELMLLPNGIYAYILRIREFAILDIDGLQDVKPDKGGLDSLKLPRGHKGMVQALVKTHFREKSLQKGLAEDQSEADVVQGKGKGLIILLHGAPGVGKTSTAECIAESSGKPLFPITCGDLGITAEEVERSLEDKFNLAQRWDCVLLLDEADVFLAQRTKTDLKRNTLVSGKHPLAISIVEK